MQTNKLDPFVEVGPGLLGDGAIFGRGSEVASSTFGDIAPVNATFTAWVLPLGPGEQGEGRIVDVTIAELQQSVALHLTSFAGEPNLAVATSNGGTRVLSARTGTMIELGAWQFVGLTITDAFQVELYVNGLGGMPEALLTEGGVTPQPMVSTIAIGGPLDASPQRFDGTIDEVRVRLENLAAEEMFTEYMAQQSEAALLGEEESL